MEFALIKVVYYLMAPPAILLIIMAAGFIIMRFYHRVGQSLVFLSFVLLYLVSISPVSDELLKPLETEYPPLKAGLSADAIVVLGGGVSDHSWLGQPSDPSRASLARLMKGITIYRHLRIPMILMGGTGNLGEIMTPDADAMKLQALAVGMPAKHVLVENKSRNTIEGARVLNRFVKGKRIVLVTSAFHMKRSKAMFEKNGFEVIPVPADYISTRRPFSLFSLIPSASSLSASSTACSEHISLFWYRIKREI